ncbi:DNA glycosylase [Hygrophoropsis aurantiaca]|uniref:DNA glycosylase n=1 Tax=Hygrophoropsis aurantiaca TaxID=72124 RepID=A0ACB8AL62_9AGAM|nr:DNA glycosylase [Hygrophoropsis aurantiaca]
MRRAIVRLVNMPLTRSSTRSAATAAPATNVNKVQESPSTEAVTRNKRKSPTTPQKTPKQKKVKVENVPAVAATSNASPSLPAVPVSDADSETVFVPAVLNFSFEEAKRHLISVDGRFEDIFNRLRCKPYQSLEQVHPFRALVQSILGQQISWLAARSINHRFIRLYDPSLPEKPDHSIPKSATSFFPTPRQVANTDIPTLRTAGLSQRKAEYIQDLATRFADGRLSTEKLLAADDEEMAKMLIEVRGIGRWTVDMFAMFSLRRPNILPVGDLGVQRGILRWFLSLHSPAHSFTLSPEKLSGNDAEAAAIKAKAKADEDVLPVLGKEGNEIQEDDATIAGPSDISSVPPAPVSATPFKNEAVPASLPSLPPLFTPSINKTLHADNASAPLEPLPEGLSVAILKNRLNSKNKVKGAILTPKEMEDLTESWKPYRSLGVYYMWALAEEK